MSPPVDPAGNPFVDPLVGAAPIEVLVVDDSSLVRRILASLLDGEPDLRVCAVAENGLVALERLEEHVPDVVVLDVEMPVLDGLATLERIRRRWSDLPVLMFSTLTVRGATVTLEALALGATDYVSKPSQLGSPERAREAVATALLPAVRSCALVRRRRRALARRSAVPQARPEARPRPASNPSRRDAAYEAIVVGASTGGPQALGEVVANLPPDLPVPVLVVQHMPLLFTQLLAERLDARSRINVRHGADGMPVEPGFVYLAPGGDHLVVRRARAGVIVLAKVDRPPENSVKPSADVLFESAAELWGPGVLAVVLTGMGRDGLAGCRAVRSAGGGVLVQDEASSVVWGMPGSVAREGLADAELPLDRIAAALCEQVRPPVRGEQVRPPVRGEQVRPAVRGKQVWAPVRAEQVRPAVRDVPA